MIDWKFFYLNDSKKEVLGVTHCQKKDQAELFFSKIKNLPLKEFKEVFGVKKDHG
tara:strand:+ start:454 stop:618 length:165 start_codon:yes stop_codon:yes gene_type:complete